VSTGSAGAAGANIMAPMTAANSEPTHRDATAIPTTVLPEAMEQQRFRCEDARNRPAASDLPFVLFFGYQVPLAVVVEIHSVRPSLRFRVHHPADLTRRLCGPHARHSSVMLV